MIKRIGKRTLALENRPYLLGHAAAVGKKEGEGPLGERFDYVAKNDRMGQRSWELAESELQKTAIRLALRKATLPERSLDLILAGDLLNQCIGSFLASMHANVPYLGQYGACSTMAQGLALGGCLVESGAADRLLAAASSHFCSAERQYRFPLAYGGQRTPTAQWTTTAAGAAILGSEPVLNGAEPCDVRVTHILFGKMVEMGVKDAANMGAAMAPEDVNLDPYIFRCAERCVLHKICCYQNHLPVFPFERTATESRQSPLMPDWHQGGFYLRKCFSYPNTAEASGYTTTRQATKDSTRNTRFALSTPRTVTCPGPKMSGAGAHADGVRDAIDAATPMTAANAPRCRLEPESSARPILKNSTIVTTLERKFVMMSAATASSSSSTGLCIEQHSHPSLYGLLYDFCSSVLEFSVNFWLASGFLVAAISNALQKPGCGLMHNLVFLISSKNYLFLFLMYSSIAAAARLPAPIARITVAAPVTASPPANTPSLEVMPCSSSATMQPLRLVSRPGVV